MLSAVQRPTFCCVWVIWDGLNSVVLGSILFVSASAVVLLWETVCNSSVVLLLLSLPIVLLPNVHLHPTID